MKATNALFLAALMTSAAIAADVSTELNKNDTSLFLDCVKATGQLYEISIDGGQIVVIPAENRTLDLSGKDAALFKCMEQSAHTLNIALGATSHGREEYKGSKAAHEVDHEFLASSGAQGLTPRSVDSPLRRRAGYYGAYLQLYAGTICTTGDYNTYYPNACQSVASPYASIAFYNPNAFTLTCTIWPHHSCTGGNERVFAVLTKATSPCQVKTTYSWNCR